MTRDDIIPSRTDVMSMAREAGFYVRNEVIVEDYIITEELESFAALIAAAEREACAKTAEDFLTRGRSPLGRQVGEAIRARGQA